MTETINGLHRCKPGNEPIQGEVKTFVIEHRPAKGTKKAWINIKSAGEKFGGTPFRILSAAPTGYTDDHGNISFNMEVEASSSQPTAFQNARETMQQGRIPKDEPEEVKRYEHGESGDPDWPEAKRDALFGQDIREHPGDIPESPPSRSGETGPYRPTDGVTEARKHLMRAANLYALCVRYANSEVIAGEIPVVHRTNEQFQSTLASLWIEASGRRCTDGVNWWSYIDRMPDKPL